MKLYQKFLEDNIKLKKLLDIYLELRLHFQELGFSENDLQRPPKYTPKMMKLFQNYNSVRDELFRNLKDWGFDVDFTEFSNYLIPLMNKINELTPLNENGHN